MTISKFYKTVIKVSAVKRLNNNYFPHIDHEAIMWLGCLVTDRRVKLKTKNKLKQVFPEVLWGTPQLFMMTSFKSVILNGLLKLPNVLILIYVSAHFGVI